MGATETGTGGGLISGGEATVIVTVAAAPGTAGASLAATAPGVVTVSIGAAMVGHGTMMMANASENLGETSTAAKERPIAPKTRNQPNKDIKKGKRQKELTDSIQTIQIMELGKTMCILQMEVHYKERREL